jgi:hypothetical protein
MSEALNSIEAVRNANFLAQAPDVSQRQIIGPQDGSARLPRLIKYSIGKGNSGLPPSSSHGSDHAKPSTQYFPQRQTSEVQSPRSGFVQPRNADNAE